MLAKIGAPINSYYLNEEDGWQPDLEDIKKKINPQTRGIVLINPNNPTGAVCSRAMLEKIADLAREHNLVVFADEIYDKLMIDGEPALRGFGRARSSGGDVWRALEKLSGSGLAHRLGNRLRRSCGGGALRGGHQPVAARRLCANHPKQYAIAAALDGPHDHLIEVRRKLRSRRDLTVQWAEKTPRVSCVPPLGAFYAFPRIEIPKPDEVFVREPFCKSM